MRWPSVFGQILVDVISGSGGELFRNADQVLRRPPIDGSAEFIQLMHSSL